MAYTYDPTTPRGQVRLLTPDHNPTYPIYSDSDIDALLSLENNSVYRAAALLLDSLASNEAYISKAVRISNLQTNGPAVAAALRAGAAVLRGRAMDVEAQSGAMFDWAEQVNDQFTYLERVRKQLDRQGY